MKCPQCGGRTEIINSRPTPSDRVNRRRRCVLCHFRFSTTEIRVASVQRTWRKKFRILKGMNT